MTSGAVALLVLSGLSAIGDWAAVARQSKPLEYVCKPLTMMLLIGVALTIDVGDTTVQRWFVAALVLSMIGDVFLMLPDKFFVAGLASFLLGHLAYIAGLWSVGVDGARLAVGVVIVVVAIAVIGRAVVRGVRRGAEPEMVVPVVAYMTVISVMVASAIGTGTAFAIAGAGLFYCSDALIAWNRFVTARNWQPIAIIVTYHVAQAGLVVSLVS